MRHKTLRTDRRTVHDRQTDRTDKQTETDRQDKQTGRTDIHTHRHHQY